MNDNASAVARVQVAPDVARRNGWPQALGAMPHAVGRGLVRMGRHDGAFEIINEPIALLGNARVYTAALHASANVDLARGDFAGAERSYEAPI